MSASTRGCATTKGDVIPTDPLQACEICTKKEHHVSDKPSSVKAADQTQVPSE